MMKQARNFTHTIADGASDFAKRAADVTSDAAKRAADATTDLAKAIGPKRGLIGLAAIGVAVGGTILVRRYLRNRSDVIASEGDQGFAVTNKKNRKVAKPSDRGAHTHVQ
jgi:hypothetical protein